MLSRAHLLQRTYFDFGCSLNSLLHVCGLGRRADLFLVREHVLRSKCHAAAVDGPRSGIETAYCTPMAEL